MINKKSVDQLDANLYDYIDRTKLVQTQNYSINKWSNQNVLDWLKLKLPVAAYESYKDVFIRNEIDGESLLNLNPTCLDLMNIHDLNLREQLLNQIAVLKIKNEYEFVKRFKSNVSN